MDELEDLSKYGAQFAELRAIAKELVALGILDLETQLPSSAMEDMADALDVIVSNMRIIKTTIFKLVDGTF